MIPKLPKQMFSRIQHVQQTDFTCTCACVAMLANVTLEEVIAECATEVEKVGTIPEQLDWLLQRFDITHIKYVQQQMYYNRLFLVAVPSLNLPGHLHHIIVDMREGQGKVKYYDPNEGYPGRKTYNLTDFPEDTLFGYSDVTEIILWEPNESANSETTTNRS